MLPVDDRSEAPVVVDRPEESRFELLRGDELLGWLEHRPAGASVILAHTEVLPGHEGEGLGGKLVRGATEALAADGKTVIPVCTFAASYIDRHPELQEHLAPGSRRR